jgi:hypothetical protein
VYCEVFPDLMNRGKAPPIVETFQSLSDLLRINIGRNARQTWAAVELQYHTYKRASKFLKGCMKDFQGRISLIRGVYLVMIAALITKTAVVRAENAPSAIRVLEITYELKQQLGIPQAVDVQIVLTNNLAFSVEPADQRTHFTISIDGSFLHQLNDQELTAAVAHELGHVWIYTHHPFLHTEALANAIALRVVSKDVLTSLYDKLQQFESTRGDHAAAP